jgi:nitroreductase
VSRPFGEVLATRRMCRDYQTRPIPDELLQQVLRAAFRGPAAGNTAGLDLLVLRDEQVAQYWDLTLPDDGPGGRRDTFRWPGLLRAPVLVVPVVDPGAYVVRYAEPDKAASGLGTDEDAWTVPYWWVDGGAATMALLLAAEDAGLGCLLFGQFAHEPRVSRHFGIPDGRRCLGTVALGWPAPGGRHPSASARRGRPEPDERLHLGSW